MCDRSDYKGTSKDGFRNHQKRHQEPRYKFEKCD